MISMRMANRRYWTRIKWTARVMALLAILALAVTAVFVWWVQRPAGSAWLARAINERIPGEVRFESVHVSLLDGVILANVRYENHWNDVLLQAEMKSLSVIDFLFGVMRARIREGTAAINHEPFTAARFITVSLPDDTGSSPLRIGIENGWLDPRPWQKIAAATPTVEAPTERVPQETTPTALQTPPIRLELSQIHVHGFDPLEHLVWQGVVTAEEALNRIEYDLFLSPETGFGREGRITLQGALVPSPFQLEEGMIRAEMFPLRLIDPIPIQSRLDGRLDVSPISTGGYQTTAQLALRPIVASIPNAATISSVTANVRANIYFDEDIRPASGLLEVNHAPLTIVDGADGIWFPPAGRLSANAENLLATGPAINALWELGNFGAAQLHIAAWPIDVSTPYTLKLDLHEAPLDAWLAMAPPSYSDLLADFDGDLAARGWLNWRGTTLEDIEVEAQVLQPNYHAGPVQISSASMDAIVRADIRNNEEYNALAIDLDAYHAPLAIVDAASGVWRPPAGQLIARSKNLLATAPILNATWAHERYGKAYLRAATWPIDASAPFSVELDLNSAPIPDWLAMMPASWKEMLNGLQGRFGATGNLNWLGASLEDVKIKGNLLQARYPAGAALIEGDRIDAVVTGDMQRLDAALTGSLRLDWRRNDAPPFSLDFPELAAQAQYSFDNGDFSIQFDPVDSGAFQNIDASWRNDGQWNVSAGMSVEDSAGDLTATLAPWLERSVEGMGEAELKVAGNGASFVLHLTSPDLTVFSFDHDPAVGVQLRDAAFQLEMKYQTSGYTAAGTLTAATPYIAYDIGDHEWLNDALRMDFRIPDPEWRIIEFTIHPPSGGAIAGRYQAETSWRATFSGLDVSEFILPVLKRFILGYPEDASPPWNASGKLIGSIQAALNSETPQHTGALTVTDFNFDYWIEPQLEIRNALISAPIAFPLNFDALLSHDIDFRADALRIDETMYENPAFQVLITPEAIGYPDPWQLPIYGGTLSFDGLSILDWDTPVPALAGRITVSELDLSKASALLPMLPSVGTLSGELHLTGASTERINAMGELTAKVFGGDMRVSHFSLTNPFGDNRYLELDINFEQLDLDPLVDYFNFGKMTGRISGSIHQLQLRLPRVGSNQLARPTRFDIQVRSLDRRTKMISRETLEKIYNLGDQTGITRMMIDREHYLYAQLGLRAQLQGDQLRLYGTLSDNLFLATPQTTGISQLFRPSDWFAIPVNIKLARPEDVIPFEHVWERLIEESQTP